MFYVIVFILGFVAGWAFFKHKAYIKAEAEAEAAKLKQSATKAL